LQHHVLVKAEANLFILHEQLAKMYGMLWLV